MQMSLSYIETWYAGRNFIRDTKQVS